MHAANQVEGTEAPGEASSSGDYGNSRDALRALRIHGVRLDQVATIEYDPGQTEINRDVLLI